ncbi:RNA polymerase sigma factor [Streptomyces sp. TRM66268-LWL]|uniref:RNA polymerase sigma factor n=1 Tax=Streptomyces polyasparticus TaxID=2767826 RepID=A0ABR7SLF7_9ACTN|nr:RNA polymerase sigma factor [Streptomyces polyasparticus]MBC9716272.1 RNA polymerase sigma factor [Streptomyces polyasparticus]
MAGEEPADAESAGEAPSDAALLAALCESDRAAFECLYRRYAPWLVARLRYRCADAAQLDDIVQESFLAVWRACSEGRQPEVRDFAGWLWRIASRRTVDAARSRAAQHRIRQTLAGLRFLPRRSAVEQALDEGEFGRVHAALDRLPPDLRAVVQATVLEGLTTQQAAKRLQLPEGTVKTRAVRARRRLREELDRADPPARQPTHRGNPAQRGRGWQES